MAHSAGHQLLDLPGWDAQSCKPLSLIFGDQRAGDIVAVPRAFFDRVARRHPVAVAINEHAGEQARLASSCARVPLGGVAGKLRLNRIPQRLIDDRRLFARMRLSLENDLAPIDAVLQHQVERAARERPAAREAARDARPGLALNSASIELVL